MHVSEACPLHVPLQDLLPSASAHELAACLRMLVKFKLGPMLLPVGVHARVCVFVCECICGHVVQVGV